MTDNIDRYKLLIPNLQISFYTRLQEIRTKYLIDALTTTIKNVDIATLNSELDQFTQPSILKRIASFGLRGEIFIPVPTLLFQNPYLLGYYRLLYGISQKEMYYKSGYGRFAQLENNGRIPKPVADDIPDLCRSLARTAELMIEGLDSLSLSMVHELQLLTLGPQLRGSQNTKIGSEATSEVFRIIKRSVAGHIVEEAENYLLVRNASGRDVLIEFFSDPDVKVTEVMQAIGTRPILSMEIKGGTDASNIHNRLGEAEKSHQKAKERGFFEFWTILRVDVDCSRAKTESPTTSRFFHLDRLLDVSSEESTHFRELLASHIGIPLT